MPNASYVQTQFTGGEWSLSMQGRYDLQTYTTAMSISLNGLPLETACWARRSGTHLIAPTREGARAVIHELHFRQANSYVMEFTDGHLRFTTDGHQVLTGSELSVTNMTSGTPAVITTAAHGLVDDDEVEFYFGAVTNPDPDAASLLGRQFKVDRLTSTTFALYDSVTGAAFAGTGLPTSASGLKVRKILDFATPFTGNSWRFVQTAQDQDVCMLLQNGVPPQTITINADGSSIVLAPAQFLDGPYLDPFPGGVTVTPSGTTGFITLTASSNIFAATDLDRHVRLLVEPAAWSNATAYAKGDQVKYGGGYYVALGATTGNQPDISIAEWGVNPSGGQWTWVAISSFTTPFIVTALVRGPDLQNTLPVETFRLGLYCDTLGWPTTGAYHGGRFWLSGTLPNRLDATRPNLENPIFFDFAPTAEYGGVADDNGIALALKATDINSVLWIVPCDRGLLVGTPGGEWLIQASTLNDPLTPTDCVASRVTKFRCADVKPVVAPLATVFVQAFGKSVIEFVPDGSQGGKYGGFDLAGKAKHLTANTITAIAYQQESTPIIWGITGLGGLRSITYKRDNPFISQEPVLAGWAQHNFSATNRTTFAITSGPSPDGTIDAVTLVTRLETADDPEVTHRVEVFDKIFEEGDDITSAKLLDHSISPALGHLTFTDGIVTGVDLFGLHYLEGQTVTAFVAGVDCGTFVVSGGTISVPVTVDGVLTPTYIETFATTEDYAAANYGEVFVVGGETATGAAPVNIDSITEAIQETDEDYILLARQYAAADWAGQRMFMYSAGHTFGSSGRIWTASMIDGRQLARRDIDEGFAGPCLMAPDGYCYMKARDGHLLQKIDLDTLATLDTLSYSAGAITSMAYLDGGAGQRMVATLQILGGVSLFNLDTMANISSEFFVVDEGIAFGVTGTYGQEPDTVYFLGVPVTLGSKVVIGVYKCTVDAADVPTVTKLNVIVPTDVDAAWVTVNSSFLTYDNTDGNLLAMMFNNNGVDGAMVKISATTGEIMWSLPIDSIDSGGWSSGGNSRIRFGQLLFVGSRSIDAGTSTQRYYNINTITGTATTQDISGASGLENQFYNDAVGVFGGACNWVPGHHIVAAGFTNPAGFRGALAFFGPTQENSNTRYIVPAIVGQPFLSKGQILQGFAPEETGSRNGPAFGKMRRIHKYAAQLFATQDVKIGTSFNELQQVEFQLPGGAPYGDLQLFTGLHQDTINDNYNRDASKLCWQSEGPFPTTLTAIGGFIQTNDE